MCNICSSKFCVIILLINKNILQKNGNRCKFDPKENIVQCIIRTEALIDIWASILAKIKFDLIMPKG